MPRKHPPREYYTEEEEVHYDVEPDRRRPRRRSKRDRVVEEEPVEDYYRRRPPAPPVEDLERMHIRGRPSLKESHSKAPPQGLKFRRGHGEVKDIPPPPPSPPSERERDEYQPPPRSKKAPPPPRGKKNKKIESDEYVYKEDRLGGRRGKGKQIAEVLSDSDVDDMSVRRSSRAAARPPPPPPPVAALPPDDYDSEEEYARRERRRRKCKMAVEPEYVREEVVTAPPRYAHKPNVGRHRGKEQGDGRRAASRPRVRSWSSRRNASESEESESSSTTTTESDTEDSDEDDDDEEDDELVVLKKEWGRGHRRDSSRAPAAIKGRKSDSSPGSPSLREASPELALRHHRRPKYIEQEYEVVQPPPPPALEPPPPSKGNYELEVRHRGRKGRSQGDSVRVPRHGRGDPYMDQPPPPRESSCRRRKVEETQIAPLKPQAIDYGNYGKDLAIRERSHRTKDSRGVRDDMELDLYSKRRPELAPYPRPPSGPAAEELPLMGAPPHVPGAFPAPHPQPMMPMARGPHPNEMGWPQPRGVPPQQYYPQPEEFSDEEEIDDGHVGPGRRYIGMKDRRDRLWTEITKDLVVRDAVEKLGYEYEETDCFFYIFSYLHYEDVAALVELSDEIRHSRRRRIHEINRGRGSYPHPPAHPQVPQMQPVAAAPAPAPAPMPVTSGPMGPMGPMAPVAPVPPPGYEKYAAAAAAAAAAANAAPAPPPPPMMNHPQPWSWDGGRGREREMAYEDSRWRTPGAWPRW